jgi:heme oxygenase
LTQKSDIARQPTGTASGPPKVLTALRAATSQRHESTHLLMPLSVDSVALGDYVAHLVILREWLVQLEAWLAHFSDGPQAGALVPARNRVALIDMDLAHVSVKLEDRAGAQEVSSTRHWTGSKSAAYRWGVCYVIEGSQLGGAVLYERLKERLAPHPLGYLKAGRGALSVRWPAFVRAMCADVDMQTQASIEEACRGACDAFDHLIELAPRPAMATFAGGE